ncbi:MAG: tetratricopeptide repeat protein [Vicinamibacterales bacterium]
MPHGRFVARLLAGVVLVSSLASSASAQNGRVNGVVREEGGQPLKGATITAENQAIGQSFTATTDDKGRFNMIGLRSGEWRFIAQAPGFSPEGGMVAVRSGGQNFPLTFELKHSGVAFFGALGGIMSKDLQADLAAADALYNQKKWDDAIAAYKAVLNKAPVITTINLQLGAAYRNKKDYESALAAYNDLLKAEPGNDRAKIEIAMTALERGDVSAAEAALAPAAGAADASRDVLFSMGELKLATNDADAAATWFEKASKADPFWAKPLVKLGEAALKKGDAASAQRLLARAVEVDPTAPEADAARTALASLKKP